MVKQIKIDDNNVIITCSIGGMIEGGMNVDFIPDEVLKCPAKWIYENDTYSENPDYKPPAPAIDEIALLKAQIEAQSEQMDFYEDCIAEMASVIYA